MTASVIDFLPDADFDKSALVLQLNDKFRATKTRSASMERIFFRYCYVCCLNALYIFIAPIFSFHDAFWHEFKDSAGFKRL